MKKALVCGISGQDGAFLSQLLIEKGYEVHGTARHVINDSSLMRPTEIMVSCGDASRAANLLGWEAKYKMRDVTRMMVELERSGSN